MQTGYWKDRGAVPDAVRQHRDLQVKLILAMAVSPPKVNRPVVLRPSELDERRAVLQRVLWSRPLEKAGRIREFLTYVCEAYLADPGVEIHEQQIGERVFGRPAGYETTQDNIVRVTASQARKKLEQYFSGEGAGEPIVLEIPKGQYTPVFRERKEDSAGLIDPAPSARDRKPVLLLAGLCVVLLGVVAVLAVQLRAAKGASLDSTPNLKALWGQMLVPNGRTDLVVTDSSLSFFQELLSRQLTLSEYLKPEAWINAAAVEDNPELKAFAQRAAQHRFTSLANVTIAYRIARLGGDRVSLFSARDFNIRQMQSDNVILLGSPRANPWVELVAERLKFRYAFDQTLRYSYFENRSPKPGEPAIYRSDSGTSLCHIALVPNLSRTGNILIIAGTEVEGTEAGGEFLTDERSMAQLTKAVLGGRTGKLPYFEVLLKGSRVGGLARRFEIVQAHAL
jgi:hypothetical protein